METVEVVDEDAVYIKQYEIKRKAEHKMFKLVESRELCPDTLDAIMNDGADINITMEDGYSALLWASIKGDVSMINALLDRGANINIQNEYGWTALHRAAKYGHRASVLTLIKRGADIELQDKEGRTALFWCIGYAPIMKILLEAGANLWSEKKDEAVPHAHVTSCPLKEGLLKHSGNDEHMKLLIQYGTDKRTGMTPLMYTASHNLFFASRVLVSLGADVHAKDHYGTTALMIAHRWYDMDHYNRRTLMYLQEVTAITDQKIPSLC